MNTIRTGNPLIVTPESADPVTPGPRIFLDARTLRPGMTGVGFYGAQLYNQLPRIRPQWQWTALHLPEGGPLCWPFAEPPPPNLHWKKVEADYEAHPAGDFWLHWKLPRLLDQWDADLYHNPGYLLPFIRKPRRAALAVTLHDLSFLDFPQAYPRKFRNYLRLAVPRSMARADGVICGTRNAQEAALNRWPHLDPQRFATVHHGADRLFHESPPEKEIPRYNLPESFFLMVGTLEPRKNPDFFSAFFRKLEKTVEPPSLVWVGKKGFQHKAILERLKPLIEKGRFLLRDELTFADLPALYRRALALIYPSHYEGFGLPLVEAMAAGCPVIAADTSCLPEVVGDGGKVLPLDCPSLWAREAVALLGSEKAREKASNQARRRGQRFTWERCAQETLAVFEKALPRP